jgi:hypothetical protein
LAWGYVGNVVLNDIPNAAMLREHAAGNWVDFHRHNGSVSSGLKAKVEPAKPGIK